MPCVQFHHRIALISVKNSSVELMCIAHAVQCPLRREREQGVSSPFTVLKRIHYVYCCLAVCMSFLSAFNCTGSCVQMQEHIVRSSVRAASLNPDSWLLISCMKATCNQRKKSNNERLEEREISMMKSREVTWW